MNGLLELKAIGNVGKDDAKLEFTKSGIPVAKFSLAVNNRWKTTDGEEKESTTWLEVQIYGERGKALQPYITSGITLYLAGRPTTSSWKNESGEIKDKLILTVGNGKNDFIFLGGGTKPNEIPIVVDDEQLFGDE